MTKFQLGMPPKRHIGRSIGVVFFTALGLILVAAVLLYRAFVVQLTPLDPNGSAQEVVIEQGLGVGAIGAQLEKEGIIRKAWAFQRYIQLKKGAGYLQAGSYMLSPSQSTQEIIAQLTHGKVATELVTILPGQRLDQIRKSLIDQGFAVGEVDAALEPTQYENLPLMVDKPKGASLEGYLFPDSYERTKTTTAKNIIEQSLQQMDRQFTPEIKTAMAAQNLKPYQGLILASIIEKEVVTKQDRQQAAQVFIKRIGMGMQLGSDVTAFYGSELAGMGQDVTYDTPYNTRIHSTLPPTPISNVSVVSLEAVAHPSATDWLFFVAGDDGTTYFSRTNAEHEQLVKQYCHTLCQ